MIKKNRLRKIYMFYFIALGELIAAAIIIISFSLPKSVFTDVLRIAGIAAIPYIPIAMYILYRLRKKDNAASSDELEQLMLQKAFALTGLVAVTLAPVLLVLVCIFISAAGWIALGYAATVEATMKFGTYYYNRKY